MTKGWLDTLLDRGNEAKAKTAVPQTTRESSLSKSRQPKAEIKSLWVQTRLPRNSGDPGECEAGYYSVADGVLTMCDVDGKPTGQQQVLGPDDDPRKIAGRLTLAAVRSKTNPFNRPINYAPHGNA